MRSLSFACLLALLCPPSAYSWSFLPHKVIGQLAEIRLNPKARQAVKDILGPNVGLADIAVCPDEMRGGHAITCAGAFRVPPNPASAAWHFINIPITDSPAENTLTRYCQKGCVVNALKQNLKTLSDPWTSRQQKQIALMFIVHFMGDVHQPLHSAAEFYPEGGNDQGGNKKPAVFMNYLTNMHSLWDGMVKQRDISQSLNIEKYAEWLEQKLPKDDLSSWLAGDLVNRPALESFKIAQDIYQEYNKDCVAGAMADDNCGHNLKSYYRDAAQPVVMERMQQAGVRLARLLEQALSGN